MDRTQLKHSVLVLRYKRSTTILHATRKKPTQYPMFIITRQCEDIGKEQLGFSTLTLTYNQRYLWFNTITFFLSFAVWLQCIKKTYGLQQYLQHTYLRNFHIQELNHLKTILKMIAVCKKIQDQHLASIQ
uniref:Transmembrane protein n=1 Tax=Rhipicephalus zambeziensis TaxID=60191 RepID=A0A224YEX4_9ACAR